MSQAMRKHLLSGTFVYLIRDKDETEPNEESWFSLLNDDKVNYRFKIPCCICGVSDVKGSNVVFVSRGQGQSDLLGIFTIVAVGEITQCYKL